MLAVILAAMVVTPAVGTAMVMLRGWRPAASAHRQQRLTCSSSGSALLCPHACRRRRRLCHHPPGTEENPSTPLPRACMGATRRRQLGPLTGRTVAGHAAMHKHLTRSAHDASRVGAAHRSVQTKPRPGPTESCGGWCSCASVYVAACGVPFHVCCAVLSAQPIVHASHVVGLLHARVLCTEACSSCSSKRVALGRPASRQGNRSSPQRRKSVGAVR